MYFSPFIHFRGKSSATEVFGLLDLDVISLYEDVLERIVLEFFGDVHIEAEASAAGVGEDEGKYLLAVGEGIASEGIELCVEMSILGEGGSLEEDCRLVVGLFASADEIVVGEAGNHG